MHYILEDPDRNNPEQTIENNSIVFHNVKLVVEYRVCPPDTCSGQAPVVDNYPRVEFLIGKLVDLHFTRIAIPELDEKITEHRTKVLSNFLRRVTTFACESDDDKSRILALLEDAFVETAVDSTTFLKPDLATVRDVLALVGATFVSPPLNYRGECVADDFGQRYAQKQATGATTTTTPCLCDMTHLCDQLDAAVRKVSKIVDGSLAKKPDLALLRVEQLQAKIARGVRSGSYDKAIWRGPWKLRSPGFLEFIRRPLNEIMLRDEHRVAYIMVWRHLFAVVGSARLFEEASFAISVDDRSAQKALECIVRTAFEHDMTTGEISGLNEAVSFVDFATEHSLISLTITFFRRMNFEVSRRERSFSIRWPLSSTLLIGTLVSIPPRCDSRSLMLLKIDSSLSLFVLSPSFAKVYLCTGTLALCTIVPSLCITEETTPTPITDVESLSLDSSSGRRLSSVSQLASLFSHEADQFDPQISKKRWPSIPRTSSSRKNWRSRSSICFNPLIATLSQCNQSSSIILVKIYRLRDLRTSILALRRCETESSSSGLARSELTSVPLLAGAV